MAPVPNVLPVTESHSIVLQELNNFVSTIEKAIEKIATHPQTKEAIYTQLLQVAVEPMIADIISLHTQWEMNYDKANHRVQ